MDIFMQLEKLFIGSKVDDKAYHEETDYEIADDKIDDEQPDITHISDLENGQFVEQRRKQKEQGLKIITPDQMLSRLAQLKAVNNSKKETQKWNKTTIVFLVLLWSILLKNGSNIYEHWK